jgi:glycolate oxidase
MDAPEEFLTLHEIIEAARHNLSDNIWTYITGGTETETTLRRNRVAIDALALRPRVLNDVSEIDCTTRLFDVNSRLPVFLCPVGGLEHIHPEGAKAVAAGAAEFGVPMLLSSVSDWSVKPLIDATEKPLSLILQLYAREDEHGVDSLVESCNEAKLPAFCITVDSAIYSRRERDIAARFIKPWRAKGEGNSAYYQASLNWKDVERIKNNFNGPLILKGIATAEDALKAIDHGVDVIYVSNHGGRQLDHSEGSLQALPEIVDAVNAKAQVVVDGGFGRGTDIAKAIALGADGVGLGRIMCYALAAAGAQGIITMLELLELEYRTSLGLLGVTHTNQLDRSYVKSTAPLTHDSALSSAYPLLTTAHWQKN